MTVALKSGLVLTKNSVIASNCGCCQQNEYPRVRVRTNSPVAASDSFTTSRPVDYYTSRVSEQDAKNRFLTGFNGSSAPFPVGRWASYSRESAINADWREVPLYAPSPLEYRLNEFMAAPDGGQTLVQWQLRLSVTAISASIVGYWLPALTRSNYTLPDASESEAGILVDYTPPPTGPLWGAYTDGQGTASNGLCPSSNRLGRVVYNAAGGVFTGRLTRGDARGTYRNETNFAITQPIPPSGTVVIPVSASVRLDGFSGPTSNGYRDWASPPGASPRCDDFFPLPTGFVVDVEVTV